jgi:hypothetical protein
MCRVRIAFRDADMRRENILTVLGGEVAAPKSGPKRSGLEGFCHTPTM